MRQMNPSKKRYFDYLEKQGKMPKSDDEMEHMADGGEVSDDFDYDEGHEESFDSAGEPHTEGDMDDEHPMEFMSRGGMVKRMSGGGRAPNPSFAKALRKGY